MSSVGLFSNFSCFKESMKMEAERLTQQLNATTGGIDSNWMTLGSVIDQNLIKYDFNPTLEVVRTFTKTLEAIQEEALLAFQKLGKAPTSCCGLSTDKLVKWMSKAVAPITLMGGVSSLISGALQNQSSGNLQVVGIACCVISGVASQVAHFLSDSVNSYERNQRSLEKVNETVVQRITETSFIISLFDRLDTLTKAKELPKPRKWKNLALDAKHIPQTYHHYIDPEKFKKFIHERTPKTKFRRVVAEAVEKQRRESASGQVISQKGRTKEENKDVKIPVFWHDSTEIF